MSKGKNYKPTVTRALCESLARECASNRTLGECVESLRRFAAGLPDKSAWRKYAVKLADSLTHARNAFTIISMDGNTKLPFAAFSTLPGSIANGGTCDGAGDCLGFCYSYRAWRYPVPFYRQLQNTLLLRFNPQVIRDEFLALPESITFRLYVDGDFDSLDSALFWMDTLNMRPDIATYGYSKSWDILYTAYSLGRIPANYMLNLSSGGKAQSVSVDMMRALPFVRGEFIAVKLAEKHSRGFKRYKEHAYHIDVVKSAREQLGKRVFSCPGTCGSCNKNGHACGTTKFIGLTIAIGIH